ncbi:hypothetical protein MKW98_025331 [Papaver atlanticum]|uniref:Uncharacterized protein n=1 Tax=Papaver atlanticum TaxID=357466 RepID=A0AAD4S5S7_9MAGN|nr:hypothetical protein MKW98_025331 [Papaver atlanticum]
MQRNKEHKYSVVFCESTVALDYKSSQQLCLIISFHGKSGASWRTVVISAVVLTVLVCDIRNSGVSVKNCSLSDTNSVVILIVKKF